MKFRIIKDNNNEYRVQMKRYFFWKDVSVSSGRTILFTNYLVKTFSNIEHAKQELENVKYHFSSKKSRKIEDKIIAQNKKQYDIVHTED